MAKTRRVLVFPAGTEVGLEIYHALKNCKEIELLGAGESVSNHGPFLYENFYELPSIYSGKWLPELVALCSQLGIDYIFPAYDDIIVALSEEAERIPAVILGPSKDVARITRSKALTYSLLGSKVRVPLTYSLESANNFPLFVKPDRGQGSQGVRMVADSTQLWSAVREIDNPIICEYLPGEEYTIDCFSDREKGLLFCGARLRLRVRNGIAVHTRTLQIPEIREIASRISATLGMYGAWFFQLKRSDRGELALLEVAPRIAGSMSAHRVQGVNFPLLTIFEAERLPIQIMSNNTTTEMDRALRSRFKAKTRFKALYIDFDDTILLRNQVNLDALKLIYLCINRNIPVILLTRHSQNINETLAKYRLSEAFDEVIQINRSDMKSDYIVRKDAIFVDDSFSERLEVVSKLGIDTFDCSMIEALIDGHPDNFKK